VSGAKRPPRDYGPVQLAQALGLAAFQVERGLSGGLIPPADLNGPRWSAAVVESIRSRSDKIIAAAGTLPDLGAWRAAEFLSGRFGVTVDPDIMTELDRVGVVPMVGYYKESPLYDGVALEAFTNRTTLDRAMTVGRLLTADQSAAYLKIRRADLDHLVHARWLEPVKRVRSGWQRRRDYPAVALYRAGDLDVLVAHPAIDWEEIRATPSGRTSALARLTAPTRST